eukprot:145366-Chlamydomonas_euryale.AAC.1
MTLLRHFDETLPMSADVNCVLLFRVAKTRVCSTIWCSSIGMATVPEERLGQHAPVGLSFCSATVAWLGWGFLAARTPN